MMFHNRTELIHWLTTHPIDRVIANALEHGTVENLGGFDPIPSSENPGWIVRVTSKHGQVHNLVVSMRKGLPPGYYCWRIKDEDIPWGNWKGKCNRGSVYDGDEPEAYERLKEKTDEATQRL
jgi:hypothetical protein